MTPLVKNISPQEISQMNILDLHEGFGEDVSYLLLNRTILQCDDLLMDQLSDVVHMSLNMFHPLMLD